MKPIQDGSAFFFIFSVVVLSIISIFGVWDFLDRDVITKSFETLGLLALVAVIVIVAGRFLEGKNGATEVPPNPVFKLLRQMTLTILIFSASILTLLGVLAIWDVITDKDVLYKSLGSVGIIAFSSLVIVVLCLDREKSPLLNRQGRGISGGTIVLLLFLGWLVFAVFGHMF